MSHQLAVSTTAMPDGNDDLRTPTQATSTAQDGTLMSPLVESPEHMTDSEGDSNELAEGARRPSRGFAKVYPYAETFQTLVNLLRTHLVETTDALTSGPNGPNATTPPDPYFPEATLENQVDMRPVAAGVRPPVLNQDIFQAYEHWIHQHGQDNIPDHVTSRARGYICSLDHTQRCAVLDADIQRLLAHATTTTAAESGTDTHIGDNGGGSIEARVGSLRSAQIGLRRSDFTNREVDRVEELFDRRFALPSRQSTSPSGRDSYHSGRGPTHQSIDVSGSDADVESAYESHDSRNGTFDLDDSGYLGEAEQRMPSLSHSIVSNDSDAAANPGAGFYFYDSSSERGRGRRGPGTRDWSVLYDQNPRIASSGDDVVAHHLQNASD